MKREKPLLGIFSLCVSALKFFAIKKSFFIFDMAVSNSLNLAMACMLRNVQAILNGLSQHSESFLFPVRVSASKIKNDTSSLHARRMTPEKQSESRG